MVIFGRRKEKEVAMKMGNGLEVRGDGGSEMDG